MRISDWSSDVCSSDLWLKVKNKITREARIVDMIIEDARAKTLICKMLDDGRTVWRHQRVWSGPGRFEIRDRGVYRGKICLLRRDGLSLNRADDVLRVEFIQSLWSQCAVAPRACKNSGQRSEEHTSELQSLMRISYAVFCLKKKKNTKR